jgi:ubiquinone/menaquinone biosynthesis C-methylase UbiE
MDDQELHQKVLKKLDGAKNLLDIGCGDGRLDVFLAKEAGIRITGLDISPEGFGHAKKRAMAKGVEALVTCIKGDLYDMAFAGDNEFDAVSLIHTLHHVEDPVAGLKEARRS